jgi:hypothetical protein
LGGLPIVAAFFKPPAQAACVGDYPHFFLRRMGEYIVESACTLDFRNVAVRQALRLSQQQLCYPIKTRVLALFARVPKDGKIR